MLTHREAKELRDLVVKAIWEHDFKTLYDHKYLIEWAMNDFVALTESQEREQTLLEAAASVLSQRPDVVKETIQKLEKTLFDTLCGGYKAPEPKKEEKKPLHPTEIPSRFRRLDGPGTCEEECNEACCSYGDCQGLSICGDCPNLGDCPDVGDCPDDIPWKKRHNPAKATSESTEGKRWEDGKWVDEW